MQENTFRQIADLFCWVFSPDYLFNDNLLLQIKMKISLNKKVVAVLEKEKHPVCFVYRNSETVSENLYIVRRFVLLNYIWKGFQNKDRFCTLQ